MESGKQVILVGFDEMLNERIILYSGGCYAGRSIRVMQAAIVSMHGAGPAAKVIFKGMSEELEDLKRLNLNNDSSLKIHIEEAFTVEETLVRKTKYNQPQRTPFYKNINKKHRREY